MTGRREIVLWRGRDDRGSRVLTATLHEDGSLGIGGQDLGAAVEAFGPDFREYEWDWLLAGADVPRAVAVLGGAAGDDPLTTLRRWTAANPFHDPGQVLKDAGLSLEFSSRVGD